MSIYFIIDSISLIVSNTNIVVLRSMLSNLSIELKVDEYAVFNIYIDTNSVYHLSLIKDVCRKIISDSFYKVEKTFDLAPSSFAKQLN